MGGGQVQRKRSAKYRPPTGTAPPTRQPRPLSSTDNTPSTESRNRAADIELRILFERGGYCRVSLLPKRPPALPDEISVTGPKGPIELVALQEDWYQDVEPDGLGYQLRSGVMWTHEETHQEWLLSGREVFVFAPGYIHRGFVSCPRLVLERNQVVACTTSKLSAVEQVLREAHCSEWTQLGEDDGVPSGWVVLRDVVPTRSVPPMANSDILNVLRPLPDIQIELEGGVRISYNTWLAGHPPLIHVYGHPEHTQRVVIDGREAELSVEGHYTVLGWDAVGNHQVWCYGSTCTYSLARCESNWKVWPAYSFHGIDSRYRRIGICGPLVRAFVGDDSLDKDPLLADVIQIPPSNPVLLGPLPGDVFVAKPRRDLRGAPCIASPPFVPVWALPAQPLLCDKQVDRVLYFGNLVEPSASSHRNGQEQWNRLILDAKRKGLPIDPNIPVVADLWHRYKAYARDLWKNRTKR